MRVPREFSIPLAFFLFSGCAVGAIAAETEGRSSVPVSEDYVLRSWEVEDGLPSNTVTGIAQTSDGYLWLATPVGLARFDGVRFTTYLKGTDTGLTTNYVRSLFVSHTGELWLGLDRGGVAIQKEGRFEGITSVLPRDVPIAWVSNFVEDPTGAIWFGSAGVARASCWKEGRLVHYQAGIVGIETFVHVDEGGTVWYSTKSGCGIFTGKGFATIDPEGGARPFLTECRKGGMWATRNQQLLRYQANGTKEWLATLPAAGQPLEVTALYEDHLGDLWIGTTTSGLLRFRAGQFVRVPTTHLLVRTVTEDRQGNLWVGTDGGGLDRITPRSFFLHQTPEGLAQDYTVSLGVDSHGALWLAGRGAAPVCAVNTGNRIFTTPPGWNGAQIMTLCPAPDGAIWIGTIAAGLWRWKDGKYERELPFTEKITGLHLDRSGNLWVATINRGLLCRMSGTNVRNEGALSAPRAMAEDQAGRLWVGDEEGGLFVRDQGQFDQVAQTGILQGEQVLFIVPDANNTIWIGTREGSLHRLRNGKGVRLPSNLGIRLDDLRSMMIEGNDFWVGTAHGLLRISRSEIEAAADGRTGSLDYVAYGRNDGLPNVEFSLGFRNATAKTKDGHLWFATLRGALEIAPENLRHSPPPPVRIEEIELAGQSRRTSPAIVLPPRPGTIKFHFTVPEMSYPEQIQFRYRLAGPEGPTEWNRVGTERGVTFAHLPAGEYRLEVAATMAGASSDASASSSLRVPQSASITFTIRAAWWETFAFKVACFAAVTAGIAFGVKSMVKRRMRAKMRVLEQEHALERERSRIARDMHDELGASLTQITISSILAKQSVPEGTGSQIDEIIGVAHGAAEALDEIVWAVNPRYDKVSSLVEYLGKFAVEILSGAGMACEMDMPQSIPLIPLSSNERHHLFLATRECLNNVVKYSKASLVRLEIFVEKGSLRIRIDDNGRGFALGTEREDSNGLRNMRERMAEIHGVCRIVTSPGSGTQVTFELPLHEAGS